MLSELTSENFYGAGMTDRGLFVENVLNAIRETEANGLKTDRRPDGLSGISGAKTVGLLQRLVGLFEGCDDICYLEVGVFQGLTLISAALEAPGLDCFGIDNFATLDPEGVNLGIVRERMAKFGTTNAQLINEDFEAALETLGSHIGGRKVGVYLVDGPHDYRSQLICLTLIKPFLAEDAVIVIDDANYPDVRWSTRDFLLGHHDFRMAFDAYSAGHPANLDAEVKARFEAGWLNGVNVLVRDSDHLLDDMLPPVSNHERRLFLNEWLAHRLRLSELAPEALVLADAVIEGDAAAEAASKIKLSEAHATYGDLFEGRYADRNMYSIGLTEGRINRLR